jgi:hypothetical protein
MSQSTNQPAGPTAQDLVLRALLSTDNESLSNSSLQEKALRRVHASRRAQLRPAIREAIRALVAAGDLEDRRIDEGRLPGERPLMEAALWGLTEQGLARANESMLAEELADPVDISRVTNWTPLANPLIWVANESDETSSTVYPVPVFLIGRSPTGWRVMDGYGVEHLVGSELYVATGHGHLRWKS